MMSNRVAPVEVSMDKRTDDNFNETPATYESDNSDELLPLSIAEILCDDSLEVDMPPRDSLVVEPPILSTRASVHMPYFSPADDQSDDSVADGPNDTDDVVAVDFAHESSNFTKKTGSWVRQFDANVSACCTQHSKLAIATGTVVTVIDTKHEDDPGKSYKSQNEVLCCAIDGPHLVLGDSGSVLTVYSLRTCQEIDSIAKFHGAASRGGEIQLCAIDGDVVAYFVDNKVERIMKQRALPCVVLRDIANKVLLKTIHCDARLRCLSLSDGFVAGGSEANTLTVWTEEGVEHQKFHHHRWVRCCMIRDNLLVSGDENQMFTVRNIRTGGLIHSFKHENNIRCCDISDRFLVAGESSDLHSKVVVRDRFTGAVVECLHNKSNKIKCCATSGTLVFLSHQKKMIAKDLRFGTTLYSVRHNGWVNTIATTADLIVTGDEAALLTIQRVNTGKLCFSWKVGGPIRGCDVLDDMVAVCDETGGIYVRTWTKESTDEQNGYLFEKRDVTANNTPSSVLCCALIGIDSGPLLVVGGKSSALIVYHIMEQKEVFRSHHEGWLRCVSAMQEIIAVGDDQGVLTLYDLVALEKKGSVNINEKRKAVRCCKVSETYIVAGDDDFRLVLLNRDLSVLQEFRHDAKVRCCDIDINQDLLLAGDENQKITIRSISTGEIVHSFSHDGVVRCGQFIPSKQIDQLLVVGDQAQMLIVRNLSNSPLPSEMPLETADFASYRPWLLQRPAEDGTTILHRLADGNVWLTNKRRVTQLDALKHYLDLARSADIEQAIVPFMSNNHEFDVGEEETPLDVALRSRLPAAAKLLLEFYFSDADVVFKYAQAYGTMSKSLCAVAQQIPNLLPLALDKAVIKTYAINAGTRIRLRNPVFKPVNFLAPGANFWATEIESRSATATIDFDKVPLRVVEVEAVLVGFPGMGGSSGALLAITQSRDLRAFRSTAIGLLVRYKWDRYGFWMHTFHFSAYLLGMLLFFGAQLGHILDTFGTRAISQNFSVTSIYAYDAPVRALFSGALVVFCVLVAYEILQIRLIGIWAYITNPWAMYLVGSVGFSILATILALVISSGDFTADPSVAAVIGLADIFLTFATMSFLRPYKLTGPLVRMLLQIVRDIFGLLILQLIVIAGFTMTFMVLLPDSPSYQAPVAVLTMFEMMLGNWDVDEFDFYQRNQFLAFVTVFAFVVYMVFFFVITMNLLISMMADSYSHVRQHQLAEGRIQTAEVLCRLDGALRVLVGEKWDPDYLHALIPVGVNEILDDDEGWDDRLKELKETFEDSTSLLQQYHQDKFMELHQRLDKLEAAEQVKIEDLLRDQEQRLGKAIEDTIKRVLDGKQ